MKKNQSKPYPSWLSPKLAAEVRKVFEPRYERPLTDEEVGEIAVNLTGYMETILKYRSEQQKEKLL